MESVSRERGEGEYDALILHLSVGIGIESVGSCDSGHLGVTTRDDGWSNVVLRRAWLRVSSRGCRGTNHSY